MFVEPGRFQDVIAQGKPSFLPGINKTAYGSARSAHRGWSHSPQASRAQSLGAATVPCTQASIWMGWGQAGLGRGLLGPWATCEIKASWHSGEGRGPRIPPSSGHGPRSSLQMAQGLCPLCPAIGQAASTWHVAQAAARDLSAAPNLEGGGHDKLFGTRHTFPHVAKTLCGVLLTFWWG